jgi:hypothetical protein
MSEVSGGGGDLLGLVVDLLLVVFRALIDHLFTRSTKVQVLKLTQSASYDSRQGWVIHLRSSRRGEKGQVATLQMARRFVAFLRQAGYRGAIPEELSVPMDLEAVPADAKALRPRTGDSRRYHKVAMLVSILLSLPIVACASSLWILAGWAGSDQVLYRLGDSIFTLGAPLTMLVLKFPDYAGRYLTSKDDLWAIPLIGLLFIMQWLIWGQLLVLIIRRLRARRDQVP